jgi:hypothetical protein
MPYRSDTIATTTKRLNSQYFLPAIQREFVWNIDRIIALFDSIMRGYPISSFLFWELDEENKNKWEVYQFVQNASDGGTRNQLANIDGVHNLTLVLDGQQRLTSILLGLKGTYTIKKKYKKWDDPDAWVKQKLFLDLFADPKIEVEDGEAGIHFGFKFMQDGIVDDKHYWFKVGKILDFDDEEKFYDFRQQEKEKLPDTVIKGQISLFEKNLERLYRAVWKDDVISYYTEHDQDYDRVLDIFVRANEGGVKLSKSNLLLSMITSKWSGINAREEIFGFVERLNSDLARKNDLDEDFIMKCCLVLSDLPVAYKVRNFNNQNLSLMQNKWGNIKDSVERTVNLTNVFGIDRDTLTGANSLVPIAYYMLQHPGLTLLGESISDVKNAALIRKWLTMSLLNNVFGGSSDNILNSIRTVLSNHKHETDFPAREINQETAKANRVSSFNEQAIIDFLNLSYSEIRTFLALSLLYDDNHWGMTPYHKDHIFPKSLFSWNNMHEAGFLREQHIDFSQWKDSIANLELLLPYENQEKLDKPFNSWIKTRDKSFLKRHLIPEDSELWNFNNFESFLAEREKLITKRLQTLFGAIETGEE